MPNNDYSFLNDKQLSLQAKVQRFYEEGGDFVRIGHERIFQNGTLMIPTGYTMMDANIFTPGHIHDMDSQHLTNAKNRVLYFRTKVEQAVRSFDEYKSQLDRFPPVHPEDVQRELAKLNELKSVVDELRPKLAEAEETYARIKPGYISKEEADANARRTADIESQKTAFRNQIADIKV